MAEKLKRNSKDKKLKQADFYVEYIFLMPIYIIKCKECNWLEGYIDQQVHWIILFKPKMKLS